MSDAAFDPAALLGTLQRHGVQFVVIGGAAAVLHGAPYETIDLDITPQRDPRNLTRLAEALRDLDATLVAEAPPGLRIDETVIATLDNARFATRFGTLDLAFLPDGTKGYEDLAVAATSMDVQGRPVMVAALTDVIRSKEAAGREKDRAVLPLLRHLMHEIDRSEK